ncbi:hypothetical protein M758_UG185000 [Ceratodon purpureus]|nr:hypothetical protein M758_UG185000 [Ceratodon purpureus]
MHENRWFHLILKLGTFTSFQTQGCWQRPMKPWLLCAVFGDGCWTMETKRKSILHCLFYIIMQHCLRATCSPVEAVV